MREWKKYKGSSGQGSLGLQGRETEGGLRDGEGIRLYEASIRPV